MASHQLEKMPPTERMLMALCLFLHVALGAGGSFRIYNDENNRCVRVMNPSLIITEACNPNLLGQKFRWVSQNQILSLSHRKCLGVPKAAERGEVTLFDCNDGNELQRWECKSKSVVNLKGQELHLYSETSRGAKLMVCGGSQCSSSWKIHGTADDICSQPYEEIYTIMGNAQGAPCRFPFRYQNQWYSDCTRDGSSSGRLWCATVPDYDKEKVWGYCPFKFSTDWISDPVTGTLYLVNPSAQLTWHQARTSCRQQYGDLLSVVQPHEHTFLSGLTASLGTLLWIGLNSLSSESGWQWSDGKPFRYLTWAPDNPSPTPGQNCAVLNANGMSMWESSTCSRKLGYICRRTNATQVPTANPEEEKANVCPSPWVPFMGHCFDLRRPKKSWAEAKSVCRKDGGDLASIRSIEEQAFIISQLGYLSTDKLWIGLNDKRIPKLFEWSDDSAVTFVSWELGEPSHHSTLKEDCVLMRGEDGKWADDKCEKQYGFICKKKATFSPGGGTIVSAGCKTGWTRHGSFCYNIGPEIKTFEEAKKACESKDSRLVDVSDRYENAFLTSMVGLRPEKYFWIGLSNMVQRDTFVWTNTKTVRFTHFNVAMPGQKQGCVAVMTGTSAGLWDVLTCDSQERYICKHVAEGVEPTTALPTTARPSCAEDWVPLGNRDFCYRYYSTERKKRKTWFEAQDFCKAIGGNLLSIHSKNDLSHLMHYTEAWIGLNALDPNVGFVWSDGSSSSYENWNAGEPNNYKGVELCVELLDDNTWNDHHCESYKDWICQIRKGVTPNPPPTEVMPEFNVTEDGWVVHNGFEYYFNTESLAMEDARHYCQKRSGDLVVINDERERVFLWKQIHDSWHGFYIGLTIDLDKTFQWMDGSPVVFAAWAEDDLSFPNSEENCVVMKPSMGFWSNVNCGLPLQSICKRSSGSPANSTLAPTVAAKGGCAPDWKAFQGKCYKLVGEIASDQKPWDEARTYCTKQGGNLVSILSNKEQAFLTAHIIDMSTDMWIGLSSLNNWWRFLWSDGKAVKFENWAPSQPQRYEGSENLTAEKLPRFQFLQLQCVVVIWKPDRNTGLWKTTDCTSPQGFICKRNYDAQIMPSTTVSSSNYQKFGNSSFQVVAEKLSWEQAQQRCEEDSAQLASIPDRTTQAFVQLQTLKHGSVWIGLNSNKTEGYFKWIDKWMFQYANWGEDEPKSGPSCVLVDVDGKWKTEPCNNTHNFVCKHSSGPIPTDPPMHPGSCPESTLYRTWLPFRDHCYSFESSRPENWGVAVVQCMQIGGSLVSIMDPLENEFISSHAAQLHQSYYEFWIGLYKNHKDQWMWHDGSVVDYTNWNVDQPYADHDCAVIDPMSFKWSSYRCTGYGYHICKVGKVLQTTHAVMTTPKVGPSTQQVPYRFYGAAVAVILFLTVAAGLGFFIFYRSRFSTKVPRLQNFENYLYFGNTPDRSVLLENTENMEKNSDLITS